VGGHQSAGHFKRKLYNTPPYYWQREGFLGVGKDSSTDPETG